MSQAPPIFARIRSLVENHSDIKVIGEASTGRQAVEMTKNLSPNIVVMDIAMPSLNGVEATRQILAQSPQSKVLILSAHSDDEYIKRAISAGASGHLIKHTSSDILISAIREIRKGAKVFSPKSKFVFRQIFSRNRARRTCQFATSLC